MDAYSPSIITRNCFEMNQFAYKEIDRSSQVIIVHITVQQLYNSRKSNRELKNNVMLNSEVENDVMLISEHCNQTRGFQIRIFCFLL